MMTLINCSLLHHYTELSGYIAAAETPRIFLYCLHHRLQNRRDIASMFDLLGLKVLILVTLLETNPGKVSLNFKIVKVRKLERVIRFTLRIV